MLVSVTSSSANSVSSSCAVAVISNSSCATDICASSYGASPVSPAMISSMPSEIVCSVESVISA